MADTIEQKSIVCQEVKVAREDTNLYIEGYGAYFGNRDSYGDIIAPGAFSAFLASEDAQRVKLCWQHDFDDVLGVIEEMREDERGLWFRAMISNTTLGKDAATLIEDGALNEFSIGYTAKAAEFPQDGSAERVLTEIYLYEISLVSRAANPKATLEGVERKQDETTTTTNQNNEEMEKEIQEKLDAMNAEQKNLVQRFDEAKADKEKTDEAIANLDASIQHLHEEMKAANTKKQTPAQALCEAIKSDEFKGIVKDVVDGKRASGKMEVKISTGSFTGTVLRTIGDTTVNADAQDQLVFLGNIRRKDVPQDKSVVLWLEGSFTDNTGYVGEGSAIGTADAAAVEEKTRKVVKIGAKLPFTREVATDLSYFLNWAREEAIQAIRNKVDTEILKGSGAGSGAGLNKVWGIINQGCTAFSASGAGVASAMVNPGLIGLVDAIDAQIALGTNNAFVANTIYMHPSDFAKYKNQKDANGRLLFEYTNGGIYTFLGKRVVTTAKMTKGTLLVADSNVFDLYEKLGFELEVERVASTDSYVLYLRWRGQLVVPSNKKKAVIYVSNIDTAIAAITAPAGSGSGSGQG